MKRVLVAPLDWGLGHATRCIPVIEALQQRNCEVLIASSGSALALLRKEFPQLKFFVLPSYRIRYPKRGSFILSIFFQLPKIHRATRKEHLRMQKIVQSNRIDLIISDNRYGCWIKGIPSIFMGHQFNIQVSGVWKVLKPLIDFFHLKWLKRFNFFWLPDDPALNLSGALSKQSSLAINPIGILSRFEKRNSVIKYDVCVMLSGPEPQRSLLEEIITKQVPKDLKIIIVRGVIEGEGNWKQDDNVVTVNFLQSSKLEEIVLQSKLIIARSGYSTIMDLARLGKKAVFIPTPGQTEQEYLAARLMDNKICFYMEQKTFDLAIAIAEGANFSGFSNIERESNLLSLVVDELIR